VRPRDEGADQVLTEPAGTAGDENELLRKLHGEAAKGIYSIA